MSFTYCPKGLRDLIDHHYEHTNSFNPIKKLTNEKGDALLQYSGKEDREQHLFFTYTLGLDLPDFAKFFESFGGNKEVQLSYGNGDDPSSTYLSFKKGFCKASKGTPIQISNFLQRFKIDACLERTVWSNILFSLGFTSSPNTGRAIPKYQPVRFSPEDLEQACNLGILRGIETYIKSSDSYQEATFKIQSQQKKLSLHLKNPSAKTLESTQHHLSEILNFDFTSQQWMGK